MGGRKTREEKKTALYELECHLVDEFKVLLSKSENPFQIVGTSSEFDYRAGRVDIIADAGTGILIAFEAKLSRWRTALVQAYRNTAFAHYSYVLMPENTTNSPLKNSYEFERRGIGLCSVGPSGIRIEIEAVKKDPLQPWLTSAALDHVSAANHAA